MYATKIVALTFFYLVTLSILNLSAQNLNSGLIINDVLQRDIRPNQIFELGSSRFIITHSGYLSNAPYKVELYNHFGQLINQFGNDSIVIENVAISQHQLILLTQSTLNYPSGQRKIFQLDTNLNIIQEYTPVQHLWPKLHFSNRSWESQMIDNQIAYFGLFFNQSPNDSDKVFGWLVLSQNGDTLSANQSIFSADSLPTYSMFPSPSGEYFANGLENLVSFPWSSTVSVQVVRKHNNNLQFVQKVNVMSAVGLPGFPRLRQTRGVRNILTNSHSLYVFAKTMASSSTSLSDTREAFSVFQLNYNLDLVRINHQIVANGSFAEVRGLDRNLVFDKSGKYIYAVGSNCSPMPIDFNEQNRTCMLHVTKLDTSLNTIWTKIIGTPKLFLGFETLTPSIDGGLIIATQRIDSTPNPNIRNLFVVKLDSAGRHSVSVPELDAQPQVTVYPNPVVDQFTLHYSQGQYESLLLYNQNGQLVYRQSLDASTNLHTVPIGHLPGGMYFYTLQGKGKPVRGKVVKGPGW